MGKRIPKVCTCRHGRRMITPSRSSRPRRPRARSRRVTATSAAANTSSPRTSHDMTQPLHVETDLEHVAVGDLVVLTLDAQLSELASLAPGTDLKQFVPANHFGADEPALQIRVNDARALGRLSAAAKRPRTRFVLARGEEGAPPEEVISRL